MPAQNAVLNLRIDGERWGEKKKKTLHINFKKKKPLVLKQGSGNFNASYK